MILNLIKNNLSMILILIGVLINAGLLLYQDKQIKALKTEKESLLTKIYDKSVEIDKLNAVILNQNTAIDEMVANENEKENLNKELKSIREQILKDLKQNDEVINQPLRDSVDFIVKRLREQENAK